MLKYVVRQIPIFHNAASTDYYPAQKVQAIWRQGTMLCDDSSAGHYCQVQRRQHFLNKTKNSYLAKKSALPFRNKIGLIIFFFLKEIFYNYNHLIRRHIVSQILTYAKNLLLSLPSFRRKLFPAIYLQIDNGDRATFSAKNILFAFFPANSGSFRYLATILPSGRGGGGMPRHMPPYSPFHGGRGRVVKNKYFHHVIVNAIRPVSIAGNLILTKTLISYLRSATASSSSLKTECGRIFFQLLSYFRHTVVWG